MSADATRAGPPEPSGRYIGTEQLRVEDEFLLRGAGRFLDDTPIPPGTAHLAFVLSPLAHARILNIDSRAAQALPGVSAVFTGEDLAPLIAPLTATIDIPGYKTVGRPALARERVRFVGEAVAVIVAQSAYIAADAVELVDVDYEPLPVVASMEPALEPEAALVHPELGDNKLFESHFSTDGFDAIFDAAPQHLSETFHTRRVAGVPLEPRGCLAIPDHFGGALTFYTSSQIPHLVRTALAEMLAFDEARIRVVLPEVGGGFGTKAHVYPEELIAAALALKLKRPLKWVQDRREELLTNIHSRDHRYDLDVAFDGAGVVQAVRVRLLTNAGAYSSYPFGCTLETTGGVRMLPGPYQIQNYACACFAVATHTCPSGAYRGVAQPSCFLAIEGVMDRIGRRLGIDPAEVRRRNIVRPDEFPYVNVVGVRYDSGSYLESLDKALENIDYEAFRKAQPTDRRSADGKLRGIGICCFTEISGAGAPGWRARGLTRIPGFDSASIRVEPTGKVVAAISQASAGQGHYTTFAQIVAEELGARIEDVTILEGDTAVAPYGTNTFASRSAVTGGGAAIRASETVREKMRRIAGEMLEASSADIVLVHGEAHVRGVPDLKVTFRDIAETAYSMNSYTLPSGEGYGLEATNYYDPPLATMANATHVALVAVDPSDGTTVVERYVVVHDCGRIINPMVVNGQIHGGTVQRLGEALFEELFHDEEGQLLNASLLEYLLPTSMDVPDIEVDHIETPAVDAVGGFKGVGEGGVIGAVPAIANTIADALAGLGANVNFVPLPPSRVLSLIYPDDQ